MDMNRESLKRHCEATCKMFSHGRTTSGTYAEHRFVLDLLEQTEWIPVSERLPEEREWIGTKSFGTTISDEVYVTFEMPNGERFTDHLSFQNGKLSPYKQSEIDVWHKGAKPIAWMPLPKPYKQQKSEDKE